ncbi:MAG: gliding motility-associated C-terminal domain-containing protein [Cytophagaceae bacterium]|jgi:gliding motility-associated-like protein|nr:gliding motility-associated C-terminal domain-containing protein [Cytophagaceae bacterium]
MKKLLCGIFLSLTFQSLAQAPAWSVTSASFDYSMQITCKLNKSCTDLSNTNNKIAAFVNGQCRGVVNSSTIAGANHLALLVVYSNVVAGEKVTFQIYDQSSNTVYNTLDTVTFSNGTQLGDPNAPRLMTDNYAPTNISISNQVVLETASIGSTIATISAVDDNLVNSFTFSLPVGVLDNARYSVSGSTLVLNTVLDYEADQDDSIEIRVVDSYGCSLNKRFKIFINDQNDPPTSLSMQGFQVRDMAPGGTLVGVLSTVDPDPLETFTYTFVSGLGDTNNVDCIIRNDSIFTNKTIVYDSAAILYIRVRTTDAGGLFLEDTFEIHVIDSFDPTDILIDTLQIKENNPPDFFISKLRTVDGDLNDVFTYRLAGGSGDEDNAQFYIRRDSLFLKSVTYFDVKNLYRFRVETKDALNHTFEKSFELNVLDDPGFTADLTSANYVSPNDDGKNDFWVIPNVEIYAKYSLTILDAFGFVVYKKESNYANEWNGKINGTPLPTGNYYYIFQHEKVIYKGNITLVN